MAVRVGNESAIDAIALHNSVHRQKIGTTFAFVFLSTVISISKSNY